MVNNNKILTVSYGTFSCTLEGFDDSFGTMKAISEYFRDLAADDRYFGAEPPTPDAEMLARIAEREISRRVAAHREDNTYVLRADPDSILPVAAKAAAAARVAEPAEQTFVAPVEAQTEAVVEAVVESVSEAPVASTPAQIEAEASPVPASPVPASPVPDTPVPASPVPASASPIPDSPVPAAPVAETVSEPDLSSLSALVAESVAATSDTITPDTAPEIAPEEPAVSEPTTRQHDPESVAAKLQRIRDVVSKTENTSDFSEDQHASELLLQDDDATEPFLATQGNASALLDSAPEALQEAAEISISDDDEDEDSITALLNEMRAEDASSDTDDFEDEGDNAAASSAQVSLQEAQQVSPEAAPAANPLRARVIKMKKADFEAAIADGYLEEEEEEDQAGETVAESETSLSEQAEAELLRELAEVEAELGQAFDAAEEVEAEPIEEAAHDVAEIEVEVEVETDLGEDTAGNLFNDGGEAEPRSARLSDNTDAQMGRILQETNSQLQEETGKGRRNAIAHLRAAVAATEAERGVGGDLGADGRDTEVYRDDLETVVRPRRPAAKAHTARPVAPLKLVAEQRIDTPKPEAPVQPRRVRAASTPTIVKPAQDAEFADYIDDVGAYNLGEVLEAAASYMAFVEGQEAFSRPQLMSKLNSTEHADTSREDRLRSFGQLLREGKIRKLGGGRFEASEHISYRPEARVAGA